MEKLLAHKKRINELVRELAAERKRYRQELRKLKADHTYRELGAVLGVSREAVRQQMKGM